MSMTWGATSGRLYPVLEVDAQRRLARRVAQQREAELVVTVGPERIPVQTPGALVRGVVHKHEIHAVFNQGLTLVSFSPL